MPQYKGTMLFNVCKCGWSESWYYLADGRTEAEAKLTAIASARSALLGTPGRVEAGRIHQVGVQRDCGLVIFPPFMIQSQLRADQSSSGWLAEYMTGNADCRMQVLRGMPDVWIERNADALCDFVRNSSMLGAMVGFRNALTDNGAQIRVLRRTGADTSPISVSGISQNPTTGYTKFAVTGAIGTPGQFIRFKEFSGPDADVLNRRYKIVSNNGTTVEVDLLWSEITSPGMEFGGKAFNQIYDYVPIVTASLIRVSAKKAGRAFFACRGRRSRTRR